MTIKELAQTINPDINLFIRFNGDELVYIVDHNRSYRSQHKRGRRNGAIIRRR